MYSTFVATTVEEPKEGDRAAFTGATAPPPTATSSEAVVTALAQNESFLFDDEEEEDKTKGVTPLQLRREAWGGAQKAPTLTTDKESKHKKRNIKEYGR